MTFQQDVFRALFFINGGNIFLLRKFTKFWRIYRWVQQNYLESVSWCVSDLWIHILYTFIDFSYYFSNLQGSICLRVRFSCPLCLLLSDQISLYFAFSPPLLSVNSVRPPILFFKKLQCQLYLQNPLSSFPEFCPHHKFSSNIRHLLVCLAHFLIHSHKNKNSGKARFLSVLRSALSSVPDWHIIGAQ